MSADQATLLERLTALETGQLSDVLDEAGLSNHALSSDLRPLDETRPMVGIAVCARGEPMVRTQEPRGRRLEADALDKAITPGAVLLIETGGYHTGSCVGGLMAYSLRRGDAAAWWSMGPCATPPRSASSALRPGAAA